MKASADADDEANENSIGPNSESKPRSRSGSRKKRAAVDAQAVQAKAQPSGRAHASIKADKKATPPARDIADLERDELIATFREVFSLHGELDRGATIREVARALGFNRTGSRINFRIRYMFPIATNRGIIQKRDDGFAVDCRTIDDYRRDDLIDALLNAMGRPWWEREEAIRSAARYLGFRRTGSQIRDAFKSAINGAIRRSLLEHDGLLIRRAR